MFSECLLCCSCYLMSSWSKKVLLIISNIFKLWDWFIPTYPMIFSSVEVCCVLGKKMNTCSTITGIVLYKCQWLFDLIMFKLSFWIPVTERDAFKSLTIIMYLFICPLKHLKCLLQLFLSISYALHTYLGLMTCWNINPFFNVKYILSFLIMFLS